MLRTLIVFSWFVLQGCSGSDGVGETLPRPNPSSLPLLAAGQHVGVIYSAPDPAAAGVLDSAFAECLGAGCDSYELFVLWDELESTPGNLDVGYLETLLATVESTGLIPYLVLGSIDTVQLRLPSDFVDPLNPTVLRPGVSFGDPGLKARFARLLDLVVPALVARGGFYLSVGNEVDAWLSGQSQEVVDDYLDFLRSARGHVRTLAPDLAVGATVTFAVLQSQPSLFAALLDACDVPAFTYYPLNGDFSVRSPSAAAGDLAAMLQALGTRPLLLQEVGYPAGTEPTAGNGSSPGLQREFVANLFAVMGSEPRIRFVSWLHLGDWTSADLDRFQAYYGIADPRFREYLGTLGLRRADGTPRMAFDEFLAGVTGG